MEEHGFSIVFMLGIINFILITFQILSGRRIIKVNLKIHRIAGYLLLIFAIVHAVLAKL